MVARVMTLAVLVLATLSAQTPTRARSQVYDVIRSDRLAELRSTLASGDVNAPVDQGLTPLVLAAAFGTLDGVRTVLDAGADPNRAAAQGLTPLHVAVRDPAKVALLLARGAKVDPLSAIGYTPLIVAASTTGAAQSVRLLLSHGANPNLAGNTGLTPLLAAALAGDLDAGKALVDAKANPNVRGGSGVLSTPLIGAAVHGNTEFVRLLLSHGADVNAVSADFAGTVKNGQVQFGRHTALHAAVSGGNPAVVRMLLDARAPVDARDIRGLTPLTFAVATDRADAAIVRLLRSHGADPMLASEIKETPFDWARKFNNPPVLRELKMKSTVEAIMAASPRALPSPAAAVERSLALLTRASARVMSDGGCVACHAQPITAMAESAARARGWSVAAESVASNQAVGTLTASVGQLLQPRFTGGAPDLEVYIGTMMAMLDLEPSVTTDSLAYYLAARQTADGNWHGVSATRAPIQDGDVTHTALAVRVLTRYAIPAQRAEFKDRVARAMRWLDSYPAATTEDQVMRLLASSWADGSPDRRRALVRELLAGQSKDGGWSQTPHLQPDAYATGQAMYALRESGVAVDDDVYRKASAFLLRSQAVDGSWHVVNRAMKIQPYFESGFPYGHDQWISHAGTAWAVMGLARMPDLRP